MAVDEEHVQMLPAVVAHEAMVTRGEVTVTDIVAQRDKIKQVLEAVMEDGVHYGRIPGVQKPTLLKPGAEMLNVTLRLAPSYHSERLFDPDGHLTVVSRCVLTHIPSGLVLGEGEGLCSSRESKYAYRRQQRTCPACGNETIMKSKYPPRESDYPGASKSDPPGWYCHAARGGCGANFKHDDPAITEQKLGDVANPHIADTWNCVTPETRILTRDLRWVPAGELVSGDVLVGVREEGEQYGRPYEDGIVTVGERFRDDLYEIRVEDGRTVRCNGEHRWLVKGTNGGVEWVTTTSIYDGMTGNGDGGRPRRSWRILSTGVWSHEDSAEAGYLAGLLDADGSLDVGNHRSGEGYHLVGVSFAQQRGGVLDRLRNGLEERRFEFGEYEHANQRMRAPVVKIQVHGGLFEQMRLLGTVRPPRLLERWMDLVDLRRRRFEGGAAKVEAISLVGSGELVRLGTTSHTYIAEGLLCHNTVLKMSDKRALVAATLNVTAASDIFTQDVEDQAAAAAAESNTAGSGRPDVKSATNFGDWQERMEQLGVPEDEAGEWLKQGSVGIEDLSEPQGKAALFRRANTAMIALTHELADESTAEQFLTDPRPIVRRAFAAACDGIELDGPEWRISESESDRLTKDELAARSADGSAEDDVPF